MASLSYRDGKGIVSADNKLSSFEEDKIDYLDCPPKEACDEIGSGDYTVVISDFPIFGIDIGTCSVQTYDVNGPHLLSPFDNHQAGVCAWYNGGHIFRCTPATFVKVGVWISCECFKIRDDDTRSYRGWYVSIGFAYISGRISQAARFGEFEPYHPMRRPQVQNYPFNYSGGGRDWPDVELAQITVTEYSKS